MNGPIRNVAMVLLAGFVVLVAAVSWLQAVRGPDLRDDPRNARLAAGIAGRERGTIITADGVVVAESRPNPDDPRLFVRAYPEGDLYGHVVGYTSRLFGSRGLEASRSDDLVSNRDATISGVLNAVLGGDLRARGLRLTIDHELQRAARQALDGQSGAVVALDPRDGAVLALVSEPAFDPALFVDAGAGGAAAALEADPAEPLRNRAIDGTYPPGSTFKIVTSAAALETGTASAGTEFDDPVELPLPGSTATIRNFDREVCDDGVTVTLQQAFTRSCNTTFAAIGLDVGAGPLVAAAEAFGFNDSIPLDLSVRDSVIPSAASFADDEPGVAQTAIGQRDVRATPIQMALVAAAVANRGEIMEPHLVAEVFTAEAEIAERHEPRVWRRAMSPAAADALAALMERVVTSGTGRRASVPGVRIAGKTGTAEVPGRAPHVWFVGFGPIDDPGGPNIVVSVVVETGGDAGENATGGTVAAPIARAVFAEFFGVPE